MRVHRFDGWRARLRRRYGAQSRLERAPSNPIGDLIRAEEMQRVLRGIVAAEAVALTPSGVRYFCIPNQSSMKWRLHRSW